MFKLPPLRLLTVAAWCLLLPASVYADPVTIGFGENAGAFSFTVVGGAVNRDLLTQRQVGVSWVVDFSIKEEDQPDSADIIAVVVRVRHVMAPHGELLGQQFTFSPGANAVIGTGMFTTPPNTAALDHAGHIDNYQAVLTFTVVNSHITSYRLHLEGRHCIGNDCPALPAEVNIPEPASMFLLGTGLAGVAIKTRKRLKNRKSG